jgi:hypothetical protein
MSSVLILPTVDETPVDLYDWFLSRVSLARGITIIQRANLTFYETRFPAQTELEEANNYWLGGHEYPLTDAEVTALTDAGYGAYISDYIPPGGYGWEEYGGGDYGYGGDV